MTGGDATWEPVERRLAETLAALADGEFVVLGEPPADPGRPRGLLRRRAAPAPTRYVQFRRVGAWLQGECVGAVLFGGDWDVSPEEHDRLRALGWRAPGDPDETEDRPAYPNYWRTLPHQRPDEAASLGVRALRLLGADPEQLSEHRDR